MTDPLKDLARRARKEPFFLASVLEAYTCGEGLDDSALANSLGCRVEDLLVLRLCRAPRTDGPGFREDIDCICERLRIDPDRLCSVVKRGRVIARLQEAESAGLMAARDREEEKPQS